MGHTKDFENDASSSLRWCSARRASEQGNVTLLAFYGSRRGIMFGVFSVMLE